MKPRIYLPEKIANAGLDLLSTECELLGPWTGSAAPVADMLAEADAMIVRLHRIGEPEFAAAPRLKVVAKHGVGLDAIDVTAATARGIQVVFTPEANANSVAEHAITLMLALAKQIVPASRMIPEGRFADRNRHEGIELAGRTLGVVGLGRIGARVAAIAAQGFGMDVLGYDPFLPADAAPAGVNRVAALDDLLARSDFLSLHVPLTTETNRLLNASTLARLKPGCRIINTSRGAVIDDLALVEALTAGTVAGAGLDVFEKEPLPADHPLCNAPNILLTPHISSNTAESLDRMAIDAAQGVLEVLAGRRPKHLVNPEVLG
jgi:D-3-phosphoglycerate dehydrogenase / 2-oxoglutarate reductase